MYADKIFVFMIGTIVGSFLNVCIHRMPKGESIVLPRSYCPHCRKALRWYDNVPVVSFLALRGRCRYCAQGISVRYPVVELLTAALITWLYIVFGMHERFFAYAAMAAALIVATFVDLETMEIPDEVSLGGLVAGIVASSIFPAIHGTASHLSGLGSALLGAIVGGGAIYAMGVFGKAAFKKEAMGGGDVKLMAMIGSVTGWKLVLLTFFLAPIFGAVVGIIARYRDGRETIPYGPYLSLAAIVSVMFGRKILSLLLYGM